MQIIVISTFQGYPSVYVSYSRPMCVRGKKLKRFLWVVIYVILQKEVYILGGSWGKFFMSDWSLTGPFWSLIAPESCSKVSLSIFYCRKVLQPIKDLCYKISLSDNIFMISKLDPAMFFFILLDSSKIKTSKKLILLTQLSVAWKWSLS